MMNENLTPQEKERYEMMYRRILKRYDGQKDPIQDFENLWGKYDSGQEMDDFEKRRWNWYQRAVDTPIGGEWEVDPVEPMPGKFWPDGVSMVPQLIPLNREERNLYRRLYG